MGVWPSPSRRLGHDDARLLSLTLFEAVQAFERIGWFPIGEGRKETSLFALNSDVTIQALQVAEVVAENVSELRRTVIPVAWIHRESAEPGLARSSGGRVIAS